MPLYEYSCESCNYFFENLVSYEKKDEVKCSLCGHTAKRKEASTFGIKSNIAVGKETLHSDKEIDRAIGAESDKRWRVINDKKEAKEKALKEGMKNGKKVKVMDIPKDKDGYYRPAIHVGSKAEVSFKKEYSEALDAHRKKRMEKGLKQFDGPGSIEE